MPLIEKHERHSGVWRGGGAPGQQGDDSQECQLQSIFGFQRKEHKISLPDKPEAGDVWRIQELLYWIRDNLLQERPELFLKDNTVRPGILVLVNEADWELMGELEYGIEEGDTFTFISTLDGG